MNLGGCNHSTFMTQRHSPTAQKSRSDKQIVSMMAVLLEGELGGPRGAPTPGRGCAAGGTRGGSRSSRVAYPPRPLTDVPKCNVRTNYY